MIQECVLERVGPLDELAAAAPGGQYGSNVMVLYSDPPALAWAREVCERVKSLVGKEAVRSTWWKIGDLGSPGVLAGAVSTAMRADVIVVSAHAGEVLPLPFYVWVDSWLPHRFHSPGALMALIAMPQRPGAKSEQVREYLRVVARQAHLDFLIEERIVPAARCRVAKRAERKAPVQATAGPNGVHLPAENHRPWNWHTEAVRMGNPRSPVPYSLVGCSSDR
jgi:hypothetical protein